jgi:hypothetical protein
MTAADQGRTEYGSDVVDEGHEMISSLRVEGTPVFNPQGEKLGTIRAVMIGKVDGRVRYAVLSFGGFLELHAHVYPIPWELLHYDVDLNGYVVKLTKEELQGAPALTVDDTERPIDREHEQAMTSYWRTMPWWGL